MRIDKNSWLAKQPIAHRGLWSESIPENSLPAYKKAAEKNYPVEIDVYLTKDNVIVSFHDDTLSRMTGQDGHVWDYTYDELQAFRLNGSEHTIPRLSEILALCENRSPLLIEIKDQPNGKFLVEKLVSALKKYEGEFAVQSFNPLYIAKIRKLAPEFIRGVLATTEVSMLKSSYDYKGYPLPDRKVKNKVCLAWTVTSYEIWDKIKPYVDNIIFEGFSLD